MSAQGSHTVNYDGQFTDEDQLRDVDQASAICLPPTMGNTVFHINSPMLHFLEMKGLYGGKSHEDPHNHLKIFIDVCGPFTLQT
ncbi:hypothetical protein KY284_023496 [Solanum tuberosum]|nr:hypothetical protein KY284_023496 [Solanum tuberosum]